MLVPIETGETLHVIEEPNKANNEDAETFPGWASRRPTAAPAGCEGRHGPI